MAACFKCKATSPMLCGVLCLRKYLEYLGEWNMIDEWSVPSTWTKGNKVYLIGISDEENEFFFSIN